MWKYSGTVACGDNYEATIINVMLEVAFKRCPKQCFPGPLVWKSKWRVKKRKKESWIKVWLQLGNCRAVMHWAATHGDMFYYRFLVDTKWPLQQTTSTEVHISSKYLVSESRQTHMLQTTHKHTWKQKENWNKINEMSNCDICCGKASVFKLYDSVFFLKKLFVVFY